VLRGNLHGAFLGGEAAAMSPCYPSVPSMFNSLEVKVLFFLWPQLAVVSKVSRLSADFEP